MKFRELIFSERGSLAPLWAIGGLLLVLSVFWVENFSTVLLKKYHDVTLSAAISRTSLLENGQSGHNLNQMTQAAGSAGYEFSQQVIPSSLVDLNNLNKLTLENRRLAELLTDRVSVAKTVEVPFTQINQSIGISPTVNISTAVQTVKVFRPLNVVLAVESTSANRGNMNTVAEPLESALRRLFAAAPTSRINIIPYSYRINVNNRCYTGIRRGDDFSFQWWEMFYGQLERLERLKRNYENANNRLTNANNSIWYDERQIERYNRELNNSDISPSEYRDILAEIRYLEQQIRETKSSIPGLKDDIITAKKHYDEQQKYVEELKREPQYVEYKPLADHYNKNVRNYKYFEDYDDSFANSGLFSINKSNFLSAVYSDGLAYPPGHINKLAVTRNRYFGDANTCPRSTPVYDLSSAFYISSRLKGLDYSGRDVLSLEGLLWAGRTVYSRSSGLSRNIIFVFVSNKDDAVDPDGMIGVPDVCHMIKSSYLREKATKLVIVAPDKEAAEKFSRFNCATRWFSNTGYIILDEIKGNVAFGLEELFIQELSQESTTKNVYYK